MSNTEMSLNAPVAIIARQDDNDGSDSSCNAQQWSQDNLPSNWENSTSMCGISTPSESYYTALNGCCQGPVEVVNGCFQYCAAERSMPNFVRCATNHLGNISEGGIICNQGGAGSIGVHAGSMVGLLAFWAVVLKAFL